MPQHMIGDITTLDVHSFLELLAQSEEEFEAEIALRTEYAPGKYPPLHYRRVWQAWEAARIEMPGNFDA